MVINTKWTQPKDLSEQVLMIFFIHATFPDRDIQCSSQGGKKIGEMVRRACARTAEANSKSQSGDVVVDPLAEQVRPTSPPCETEGIRRNRASDSVHPHSGGAAEARSRNPKQHSSKTEEFVDDSTN